LIFIRLVTYTHALPMVQDLYPDCQIDVELSDEDINGQEEPAGDDAGGEGAPSVETLAPNPFSSSLAAESCPSTADQTTTTAPSGGGQKKKCVALGTKRK
jgi:hypothetical protein